MLQGFSSLSVLSVVTQLLTLSSVGKWKAGPPRRLFIQFELQQVIMSSPSQLLKHPLLPVLNIAEKNSVAKEIARHLSKGGYNNGHTESKFNPVYQFDIPEQKYRMRVSSVRGHVIQYTFPPQYKTWSKYNPRIFFKEVECLIEPNKEMGDLVRNLKQLAKGVDLLVLWLDCDREGEAIAFEVVEIIRSVAPRIQIKRARFSAVTFTDVWNAFNNLVEPNKYEADAVNYRREVDLRLGVSFTIFQTLTLQSGIGSQGTVSYGPCQFPTLGFVVQRFEKVKNFLPQRFWMIKIFFANEESKEKIQFKWRRNRLFCEISTNILYLNMVESFQNNKPVARVMRENKNTKKRFKPYPLATIELQKIGTKKLGMTSKEIMDVAEKLYQKGFISYPRTETTSYTNTMDLLAFIRNFESTGNYQAYASKLLAEDKFLRPRAGNKNDQAHPPIHPVKAAARGQMTDEEWKVYDLISRHFLASCSKDAQAEERIIDVSVGEQQFFATHLTITAQNFLQIYIFDKWTQSTIPQIPPEFSPICNIDTSETAAPNYLTEAQLIGMMDKNQIGTDSTIHEHIKTIQDRSYAMKINNSFRPTPLGLALVKTYNQMGIELSNCWVRRNIEVNMNEIVAKRLRREDAVARTIEEMMPIFDKLAAMKNQWVSIMRTHLPNDSGEDVTLTDPIPCGRCGDNMALEGGALMCRPCRLELKLPAGSFSKTNFVCPICHFPALEMIKRGRKFPDSICPMCYNNPPEEYKSDRFVVNMECNNCTFACPKAKGSTKKDLFSCPLCKNKVNLKAAGSGGRFMGCGAWPACKWSRGMEKFVKNVRILNETCEKCQEETMGALVLEERMVENIDLLAIMVEKSEEQIRMCVNPGCSPMLFLPERMNQKGDNSHNSHNSHNSSKASKEPECFRCKKTGHYANNCPNPPHDNNAPKKQKKGYSQDSTAYKSHKNSGYTDNRKSFDEKKSPGGFKVTCYSCKQEGHIAPNCPNKNNSNNSNNNSYNNSNNNSYNNSNNNSYNNSNNNNYNNNKGNYGNSRESNPKDPKGCTFCGVVGRHPKGSQCGGLKRNKSKG